MTESKRCESTHIYLLSFILPMIVLTTMFVGDWTTSLGIIIPLTLYPLLDVFSVSEKAPCQVANIQHTLNGYQPCA